MSKAKRIGVVKVDKDYCKGCSLCVNICPVKILELNEHETNRRGYHPARVIPGEEDKCIACISCGLICPDSCIEIELKE